MRTDRNSTDDRRSFVNCCFERGVKDKVAKKVREEDRRKIKRFLLGELKPVHTPLHPISLNLISMLYVGNTLFPEGFHPKFHTHFLLPCVLHDDPPTSLHSSSSSRPAFRSLFSPVAHPNLSNTHDGTPQNVASRKGGTKLYMATNTRVSQMKTVKLR
jgi:hypothetical protein